MAETTDLPAMIDDHAGEASRDTRVALGRARQSGAPARWKSLRLVNEYLQQEAPIVKCRPKLEWIAYGLVCPADEECSQRR